MNADVAVLRPKVPEAVWPVLAMVFGVIGGLAAVRDIQSLLIVALAGLVFVAAVFRRIEVGLFALLLTLPLDIYGRVISGPIPLTVFQIVLAATLVAWFARIFTDARQWCRLSVMDMSVLVLVVAAFVSITFSAVPGDTLYAAVRVVFLWLFMLLVENGIRTEQRLERYFDLLIVTAVFFGLFGIAQQYVPGFDFGSTCLERPGFSRIRTCSRGTSRCASLRRSLSPCTRRHGSGYSSSSRPPQSSGSVSSPPSPEQGGSGPWLAEWSSR
jgi:hypothetical protein